MGIRQVNEALASWGDACLIVWFKETIEKERIASKRCPAHPKGKESDMSGEPNHFLVS